MRRHLCSLCFLLSTLLPLSAGEGPAPVVGFQPPAADEHPRLFLRAADLAALRARAATAAGRRILSALECNLGSAADWTPQGVYLESSAAPEPAEDDLDLDELEVDDLALDDEPEPTAGMPIPDRTGPAVLPPNPRFTFFHGAGYGTLYQATGEERWANLARQAVELVLMGLGEGPRTLPFARDGVDAALGLAGLALAYDLAGPAWEPTFRRRVVRAMLEYVAQPPPGTKAGGPLPSFAGLLADPGLAPGHRDFPTVVAGCGLVLLAVAGDTDADGFDVAPHLARCRERIRAHLEAAWGDRGTYIDRAGPSHWAANVLLVPFLQAERLAAGQDWVAGEPSVAWLTQRWIHLLQATPRGPIYACRGGSNATGSEWFLGVVGASKAGTTLHHGGWFSQGFGLLPPAHRAALKWTAEHTLQARERVGSQYNGGKDYAAGFDVGRYGHRALLALVNWPFDQAAVNPAQVASLPRALVDRRAGLAVFRDRWQDEDDIVVSIHLGSMYPAVYDYAKVEPVKVWGLGRRLDFPAVLSASALRHAQVFADGSGTLAWRSLISDRPGDGAFAVDFSATAGVPLVVAGYGPGVGERFRVLSARPERQDFDDGVVRNEHRLEVAGQTVWVLTVGSGEPPPVAVAGDGVTVGGQRFRIDAEAGLVMAQHAEAALLD